MQPPRLYNKCTIGGQYFINEVNFIAIILHEYRPIAIKYIHLTLFRGLYKNEIYCHLWKHGIHYRVPSCESIENWNVVLTSAWESTELTSYGYANDCDGCIEDPEKRHHGYDISKTRHRLKAIKLRRMLKA